MKENPSSLSRQRLVWPQLCPVSELGHAPVLWEVHTVGSTVERFLRQAKRGMSFTRLPESNSGKGRSKALGRTSAEPFCSVRTPFIPRSMRCNASETGAVEGHYRLTCSALVQVSCLCIAFLPPMPCMLFLLSTRLLKSSPTLLA